MGGPRLRSVASGADRPDDDARLTWTANLGEDRSRPRLRRRVPRLRRRVPRLRQRVPRVWPRLP